MRPGVPWNIKDISPEAREAAQVAASRAGLSLGEWLSQAIAQEAKTVAAHEAQAAQRAPYRPQSPVPPQGTFGYGAQPQAAFAAPPVFEAPRPQAPSPAEALHIAARNSEFTVVAHGLRDLADRLESTERRQTQAISAINQNVAAMADKVDAADRIKTMAETAFATAAEAINQSTRDQASAFESLEKTVSAMNERLQTVERTGNADAAARETLSRLENALDGFKTRLSDAERRGHDAQASLENWVKTLNTRIEQAGMETSEAIRTSSASMERNLETVRTGLAEQERRAQERAEAMSVIQNGLLSMRAEIADTDKRAREAVSGVEKLVKDLNVRVEQSNPASDLQKLAHSIDALRQEVRATAESVAAEAVVRERAGSDLRTQLDAATGRLTTQIAQAEARNEGAIQTIRETFAALESQTPGANPDTDAAIQTLQQAVERVSLSVANADQANAQTAQRQAAAIRKVEDMLQGFARGLDTIGDISKGPLAQPMSAVQATLETITAKIEESDARAADSASTIETALKALAGRIEEVEKRQSQSAAQFEAALKPIGERLESAELREKDLHQRLEDSFRDVLDRIEDSERKAADSVEAVEAGLGTINQRLDAADRRHKEAVAGLRLTVDGLVAKAAAEPLLTRTNAAAQSLSPQLLTAAPPPAAYAAPSALRAPEAPFIPPAPPIAPPPVIENFAPPPAELPAPRAAALEMPPKAEPPPLGRGYDDPNLPALTGPMQEPPAPSFEDLLANAAPAPEPPVEQATAQQRGPLPPLDPPLPPKRADDFLAQARKAAQAAALADQQAQAAAAASAGKGGARRPRNADTPENERNLARIAIGAIVLLALIAGAIALIILAPWRASGDDVNRPAPGSSLSEMMTPQPSPEAGDEQPAATAFTELPPPPADAQPAPVSPALDAPAIEPPATGPAPAAQLEPSAAAPSGEAIKALEASAQRGDAKSQYLLSKRYAQGGGVTRDLVKAAEWLRKSAQAGFPAAQYQLGTMTERGGDGVTRDPVQARVWYEKAAINGNRKAMHNLAVLHAEGVGTAQNFQEAAKWFQRGAEFGLTDSQYNLGILYERGMGIAANRTEAAKWFAIAAAQGDADAATKLQAMKAALPAAELKKAMDAARNFMPKAASPNANDFAQSGN
jgi:localization factor PodJL